MQWLRGHGVASSLAEYEALPFGVLIDCRMLMQAEGMRARMEAGFARQR